MKSDMLLAVMQLSAERNLPQESVVSAFEDAIAAAYRRDPAVEDQDVKVKLDPESGDVVINTFVHVVDEVDELDPRGQVDVDQARSLSAEAQPGDDIITGVLDFTPQRIAARTVTQVLMQRLRSAERRLVYEEYADKEGEIISAPVRRVASPRMDDPTGTRPTVFVDLGKADATMPGDEQSANERYRTGMELKFYVVRVNDSTVDGEGTPEIVVSRRHPMLLRRLMELEVPEVKSGLVEIKSIARQAGARSKVAVYSNKHDIDPIGACVGLRGIRIQNIVTELMGEKIDILEWSDNPAVFIANSLGPAQVEDVIIVEDQAAEVIVPENQLSLAIGKEGQNVSLATRLTNFRIDIKGSAAYAEELIERQRLREAEAAQQAAEEEEASRIAAEAALQAVAEEAETEQPVEVEEGTEYIEPEPVAPVLYGPESDEEQEIEAIEPEVVATPEEEEVEADLQIAAQHLDDAAVEESEPLMEIPEEETFAPPVPSLFVPDVQRPEPPPSVEIEDEEEDLDLELLELEEKLKELELEEQERLESEREAAELESLDQDIDSDDLWALPDDFQVSTDTGESGLRFAEDISGYRDEEGRRGSGRGRRGGGARRIRR
ncbi:MAG: transcription termination/antitermination protein NusA [Chloroflexi bacterium]|nr:transcription termination/antitermination protein NusA [Chloroflexota bacterium]MYK61955.1 transcription termination/antitermination protein NusA [Chloroflexota bacterium]